MSIAQNIAQIRAHLPSGVELVCVSKFHPQESIKEAYDAGERVFGESRVQELLQKQAVLPKDIKWHFIGHLQSNKVRQIVPFVSLIHAVDSADLLRQINGYAEKSGCRVSVLLQVHIARENQKFGFLPDELRQFLSETDVSQFAFVDVCGLMGMATFTDDEEQIRAEFQLLSNLFREIKTTYFVKNESFKTLSMGMSDDFPLAVVCGSNMVRIGSSIFGVRNY